MHDDAPLVAVLAAGSASRFGGRKLDAMCAGKRVGQWVLETAIEAGLAPGEIVVGRDIPQFARDAIGWSLSVNSEPESGLGSSVLLAATKAMHERRDLVILLADMPLVAAEHLRRLADCKTSAATCHPDGRVGVPVCIRGSDVARLTQTDPSVGAASIIANIAHLAVFEPPEHTLRDVDTPGDLERVESILLKRANATPGHQ